MNELINTINGALSELIMTTQTKYLNLICCGNYASDLIRSYDETLRSMITYSSNHFSN
ncbi:MAG: hypothetical protein IJ062_02675 [Firmicutes bacterium]|nr:hypothetical protein [Bacillota bacterium]